MNTINDGGPVFPTTEAHGFNQGEPGITARDYFAAKAPISVADALIACAVDTGSIGTLPRAQRVTVLAVLAEMRLEYADAMIAARAGTAGTPDAKKGGA
jgi:hypothetical protein